MAPLATIQLAFGSRACRCTNGLSSQSKLPHPCLVFLCISHSHSQYYEYNNTVRVPTLLIRNHNLPLIILDTVHNSGKPFPPCEPDPLPSTFPRAHLTNGSQQELNLIALFLAPRNLLGPIRRNIQVQYPPQRL